MSEVTRYRQYAEAWCHTSASAPAQAQGSSEGSARDNNRGYAKSHVTIRTSGDGQPQTDPLTKLLLQMGLTLQLVDSGESIPGSFWGDEEAGLIQNTIYGRDDTPVHSFMHEACHYVCMDEQRRSALHTNAGGSSMEENAVCYLQLLLADALPGYGRETMFKDMDAWGYSFRLGSAQRWFNEDADDARQWLECRQLLDFADELTELNRAAFS